MKCPDCGSASMISSVFLEGNMPKTTIALSLDNHRVLMRWKKHYGCKTVDALIGLWIDTVKLKKQEDLYRSLPAPAKMAKPLSGKRLRKNYKK